MLNDLNGTKGSDLFLILKWLNPSQIHSELLSAHEHNTLAFRTLAK
jgi:hypothetical protein